MTGSRLVRGLTQFCIFGDLVGIKIKITQSCHWWNWNTKGQLSQQSFASVHQNHVLCHFHFTQSFHPRGCLHDTEATFSKERVHSSSLPWLYICLHDTTTKCHAGASHPGVSSPRLLYRSENFTPVRNLATVSNAKRPHVSVWHWSAGKTGTGSACVTFAILNHTCILSTWCLPSNNEIWHDPMNHHVNAIQNQKVVPVWNTRRCEFSHVNAPLYVTPFYCERFHDSTWSRLEKYLSSSTNPLRKRSGGPKIS